MRFLKIEGVYYNVNYIKSVKAVISNKVAYEFEVLLDIEGAGTERFGFKTKEDAEEFVNDIMRQII